MKGKLAGAEEAAIKGQTTYEWLPGGFFMQQHVVMDFTGFVQIDSHELIGYDPGTGKFPSQVFSNPSPTPLPYTWELEGDNLKITVSYGPLDAIGGSRAR